MSLGGFGSFGWVWVSLDRVGGVWVGLAGFGWVWLSLAGFGWVWLVWVVSHFIMYEFMFNQRSSVGILFALLESQIELT